jgi:dUTP pyrophosphatase
MKVKIKKLHKNAVIPFKTYNEDFCYDVVAVSEEEVAPNVWKYGLGFALQIERGNETLKKDVVNMFNRPIWTSIEFDMKRCPLNLSIDLRPRSSVWKTGMVLSNCVGTVDEEYTGEISAVFYHVMPDMPRYKAGDRIGQIKIGVTFPIEFVEVEELSETERGEGSYGSSGK